MVEKSEVEKRYEIITAVGILSVGIFIVILIQDYKYVFKSTDWSIFEIISFNVGGLLLGLATLLIALSLHHDEKRKYQKNKNKNAMNLYLGSYKKLK